MLRAGDVSSLAPLFKSGKWGGVPADAVPTNVITFMLGKDDLFHGVRTKLETELERRRAAATDDETEPARELTPRRPRPAATAEPLPEPLQDDEPFDFRVTCPHCGRAARATGTLSVTK